MTEFNTQQYINGQWVDALDGGSWDLVNPADESVLQQVPFGGRADAQLALEAAAAAFPAWAALSPYRRARIIQGAAEWIREHAKELARITTEESGKPFGESLGEWRSAPSYLEWAAEEGKRIYGRTIPARAPDRRIIVSYHPLGVVGTITAWNFPVYNVVRAWSSALAAGCTVVGRPSEYTPRSAMAIAQAFAEAGAPPGVVNLINGDPEAMGQAMLDDPRCRKIAFTGSTRVGRLLLDGASRTMTRLSLELGGNAPVLIFPDVADVRDMAQQSIKWKMRNNGQVCIAPQRFYVHSRVAEEFLDHTAQLIGEEVLGPGLERGVTIGPLINAGQRDRVERIVGESVAAGAQLLAGGARPASLARGYFYEPTLLAGVPADAPVMTEEIFGPVLPVIPFDDVDEAIAMANDSEYGLTAFVFTNDLNTALLTSEALEYGMVAINDWLPVTAEAPFGGVKQSGLGRESGAEGLYEYLEPKTTYIGGVKRS